MLTPKKEYEHCLYRKQCVSAIGDTHSEAFGTNKRWVIFKLTKYYRQLSPRYIIYFQGLLMPVLTEEPSCDIEGQSSASP